MSEIWISKQEAATLIGKQGDFVRAQILPRMVQDGKRRGSGRGAPWELRGSAVVQAYVEYLAEAATGDPESYSVSDSPALERQRMARARLLEYELAERCRELISVELFQRAVGAAFLPLRKFAEEQITEHGNGTADAWADAVEEFSQEIQRVIGQPVDTDREDEPAEAPKPAGSSASDSTD